MAPLVRYSIIFSSSSFKITSSCHQFLREVPKHLKVGTFKTRSQGKDLFAIQSFELLPSIFLIALSIVSSLFNFFRVTLRIPLRSSVSSSAVKTMSLSSSLASPACSRFVAKISKLSAFFCFLCLILEILLFRQQNYPRICFSF